MENLTPKEKLVLTKLIDNLYAEEGFSDVCPNDLATITELPPKSVGGILTSLQAKGYVWVSEPEYWMGKMEIPALVYLCEEHYNLHPKWEVYIEGEGDEEPNDGYIGSGFDGEALASAGFGTDEDYGCYGGDDW